MSFFLTGIMHRYIMHSENVVYGKWLVYVIKWVKLEKWSWEQWIFLHVSYLLPFPFWFYYSSVHSHVIIKMPQGRSSMARTCVRKLFNSRPRVIKSNKMKELEVFRGGGFDFPRRNVTQWIKCTSAYQSNLNLDLTMTAGQVPEGSPGTSQGWVTPETWQLHGGGCCQGGPGASCSILTEDDPRTSPATLTCHLLPS